jgi:hypothetical protein
MDNKIIAVCGIICSECDAYLATQAGDIAGLERVAAAWNEQYKANFTAEAIPCDGCLATEGRLCSHCFECKTRACAIDHGVDSCAYCADFGCATFMAHMNYALPEQRQLLETLRVTHLAAIGDQEDRDD